MKNHLFYTFLAVFAVTACVTLLGITNVVEVQDRYLAPLVTALLVELVGAVVGLYRVTNFFEGNVHFGKEADKPVVRSGQDGLAKSDFVAPLRTVESSFLQVLLDQFSMVRSGSGVALDIRFEDSALAIWSRKGKEELNSMVLDKFEDKVRLYQKELEDFLIRGEGDSYQYKNKDIPFRYASGGVLPIVRIKSVDYYCLIYREVRPIGWNMANGGCDNRNELKQPVHAMMRELNEELVIVDPEKGLRYVFGNSPDMPEFVLVRKLLEDLLPNINFDQLAEYSPELRWEPGPDQLTVRIGISAPRITRDCFLTINATDLGIELDRIAHFEVAKSAIFLDGELTDGETPGYHVVNAPIGLFETQHLNDTVRSGSHQFTPDFFYWNGRKFPSDRIEEIIRDRYLPSMANDMNEADKIHFEHSQHIMDLCPVTENIIRRAFKAL